MSNLEIENADLRKRLATADARIANCDAELQRLSMIPGDPGGYIRAELQKEITNLTERLTTAEADNAALLKVLDEIRKKSYEPDPELPALSTRHEIQLMAEGVMVGPPHPGTSLTQRLAGMEEALREAHRGLHLAGIICDAVPTRAHELKDNETLKDLGLLVNQGQYQIIRDAEQKVKQALEGEHGHQDMRGS